MYNYIIDSIYSNIINNMNELPRTIENAVKNTAL